MRRLLIIGSWMLGAVLLATVFAVVRMNQFLDEPVNVAEGGTEFEIVPGASFRLVSNQLADQEIISHAGMFRAYARWVGQANEIQAGDYKIKQGTTPVQLLEQFTSGAVQLYSFTIIEGWNQWELLDALHENTNIEASMTDEDWPALLEELEAPTDHPEGLFLPETYHFARGTRGRAVLTQAYELMQTVLREEWAGRAKALPIKTPYEALTLASIIEKETARGDERAKISGVFVRRLEKRMRLQTDPTVIYGIGKGFNGNLTRNDLKTDTPYNTYTRHGLPPSPIAMPGRAAIHAALHPAPGEELFFVATGLGDGSHAFSTTKAEHDAAVIEYLKRLRRQRQQGN
ncbi:MAG: endolytic transglycosylase MltG [Desulfobulbaceae bacterium]|nr:endolytic transglycosylase MltG [Desulfobulbaceae bacterium]